MISLLQAMNVKYWGYQRYPDEQRCLGTWVMGVLRHTLISCIDTVVTILRHFCDTVVRGGWVKKLERPIPAQQKELLTELTNSDIHITCHKTIIFAPEQRASLCWSMLYFASVVIKKLFKEGLHASSSGGFSVPFLIQIFFHSQGKATPNDTFPFF